MKKLNGSSVKASDMAPAVCAIMILVNYSWQFILYNSVENQLYTCLKCNENMKNLNSSCVKASDMVPEVYVGPISQNYISQFFFLILEWINDISV